MELKSETEPKESHYSQSLKILGINEDELEALVGNLRIAGNYRDLFRNRFIALVMLHLDYMFRDKKWESEYEQRYPKQPWKSAYWKYNTPKMAELITEITMKNIETGSFYGIDKDDNHIRSYAAILYDKMKKVANDLIMYRVYEYKVYFNEDIPSERAHLSFLEEAERAEYDEILQLKLRHKIGKEKRKLRALESAVVFVDWMRNEAEDEATELYLMKQVFEDEPVDILKHILDCFKCLTDTQKKMFSLSALRISRSSIAEIYGVTASNVTQVLEAANKSMIKCLTANNIKPYFDSERA